ncbi:DNA translocase FtsK 4TM domain-containing protein [Sphingomonas sp. ID0503]|uniref:FtsK/SpoIIIE family DNA translocase n=1 Tax=Sphingomonas sp. ID0503 TaxID=3399691 RepID=UPI003AFA3D38
MASIPIGDAPQWRDKARRGAARGGALLAAVMLVLLTIAIAVALVSFRASDASLNTAAGTATANLLGPIGAWVADAMLTFAGPAAALVLPVLLLTAVRIARDDPARGWKRASFCTLAAIVFTGLAIGCVATYSVPGLPASWGGVVGIAGGWGVERALGFIPDPMAQAITRYVVFGLFATAAAGFFFWGLALDETERAWLFRRRQQDWVEDEEYEDDAEEPAAFVEDEPEPEPRPTRKGRRAVTPDPERPVIADPRPQAAQVKAKDRQPALDFGDGFRLPPLDLLKEPPAAATVPIDKAALEKNARLLESVLEDFHVKGRIVEVRPGPVVTMYELEPASGIKASRVIALADDIARNMSALSARVAVIPGRTVIGIELPNAKREGVVLSQLVGSSAFQDLGAQLPMVLGKNIAGEPVVADLAPMPHLLVAGTTGSGKSVGLNCMILSLLYRLTPDECRMIMIDPKMLELSIYDDIPHLLSPVVTDPPKAIRALKWAVEQMEDRYRMMASIGVRGLASFNEKVRAAKARGQSLGRRVQTGYDQESGQPVYEEEKLDYDVLPQIVVIVDELADLMMTAGKEVEFLIQRLAQKARAAGIHLIMATQRPSVDVITGVIKANLPTRISFAVTSKIDSRTILGEQGAEQLLGKGDMLYMPGGKQIARVHGPFVSDEEVRAIADFWRSQGTPDYISAVTEEPEDGGFALDGAPEGDDSPDEQLYRKAVQTVAESQKASTSYVQRQLRIGYNSAARMIERMEKEGLVGRPDHVGRREVLIDTDGRPV